MPLGPVALLALAGAVVFAFLKARHQHQARYHRTMPGRHEDRDDDGPPRLRHDEEPVFTEKGEEHLRRARLFGRLFYLFAAGALIATWLRL